MKISSKQAKEIETIIDEVRHILYNNRRSNSVEIHLLYEVDSAPTVDYAVKDKVVIVDEAVN